MKNVLITVVSALNANPGKKADKAVIPFPGNRSLAHYHTHKGEIAAQVEADNNNAALKECRNSGLNAYQTNEACCKYLISRLDKSHEQMDEVFAVTTKMACSHMNKIHFDGKDMTSYKYFTSRIASFCRKYKFTEPHIRRIVLTRKEEKGNTFDDTLRKIADEIFKIGRPHEVKIYLDIAGGIRNVAILIQLLTKLLTYYGYTTEAYYTHLEEKRFLSCNPAYKQMNILDAVNEFVCYGSARQLKECFGHVDSAEPLISSMLDFHDAIQLCKTENLDEILNRMNQALLDFETEFHQEDNAFILRMMIPLIREKFFQGKNEPDYCSIIRWCLENGYIQQALTIYTEMIPKYIFQNNLITISPALKAECREKMQNNPAKSNLEAYIFYDNIMSSIKDNEGERVERLKKAIETLSVRLYADDSEIACIVNTLRIMQTESNHSDFKNYIYHKVRNGNGTIRKIAEFSQKNGNKDLGKLKNSLTKSESFLYELLGLQKPIRDTFDKKLTAANNITEVLFCEKHPGSVLNISEEAIKKIMLDYIYVKAIRNQINHASSDENLKEHQKEDFTKQGYTVDNVTPDSIRKDLLKAINFLQNCRPI